ncbi:tail fiber domain-containing protein [Pedobacter sp. PLR]|uniref:tail fiber domain-containing protein n=1 Tax=Pedobacter sp. PLR TaxID=2994465 RepID=UPI002247720E|nr:tail fiber domain-containing protein [Pedobacter sp. PLR]MCX2454092.1 tail fiber domain-containing protein [Pedobacter sp. PLR]
MNINKCFVVTFFLVFTALLSHAQTPFFGRFYLSGASEVTSTPSSDYSIEGTFTDPGYVLTIEDILVGDIIVDNSGLTYRIDKITSKKGDQVTVDVTYLRGAANEWAKDPAIYNTGAIYRPTSKGYALDFIDQEFVNDRIRVSLQNSAIQDIDRDIRAFKSGTDAEIPKDPKFGDIFYNVTDKKLYAFTEKGWVTLGGGVIASGAKSEFPTPAKAGEMFFNKDDNNTYIYNGTLWFKISTNGSTPTGNTNPDPSVVSVREGDLFYNDADKKLYVYNKTAWVSLDNVLDEGHIFVGNASSEAVSVPLSGDAAITSAGKLTINNLAITNEKLDKTNIPLSGFGFPNADIRMGNGATTFAIKNLKSPSVATDAATKGYIDDLFKNPSALVLENNNLFVGNTANIATAVPKIMIPISGFANAMADVHMGLPGQGAKYKIVNMAEPVDPQDAVTKNYVDTRPINPTKITLTKGSFLIGGDLNLAVPILKSGISITGFAAPTAELSMAGFKLTNLKAPELDLDAVTKKYVDEKVITPSGLSLTAGNLFVGDANGKAADVLKSTIPLSGFAVPKADVSFGGFLLTNLAEPKVETDAVTKKYVDGLFKVPETLLALPEDNMFVGNATGKAAAIPKVQIPLSGFAPPIEHIAMGDAITQFQINFMADPKQPQDAATKKYVDAKVANPSTMVLPADHILVGNGVSIAEAVRKSDIPLSDLGAPKKNISFGDGTTNFKLINLADPETDQEAATKAYVDSKTAGTGLPALSLGNFFIGDANGKASEIAKTAIPLSGFGAAIKDVELGGFKLSGLSDPALAQDAATKAYVDSKTAKTPQEPTAPITAVAGDTYYNTTDQHLYVYNGTEWIPMDNKLDDGNLYLGNAKGIATSTLKTAIPLSGFGAAIKDVELGGFKLTGLSDPALAQDAATKAYVDSKTSKTPQEPTAPTTAVAGDTYYNTTDQHLYVYNGTEWIPMDNKLDDGNLYVGNAKGIATSTLKTAVPLSGFGAAVKDVEMGAFKISNLADPIAELDAVNKKTLDAGLTAAVAAAKDNLGNHTAVENIKLGANAISGDGGANKGITFEADGSAIFAQSMTIRQNFYTPSDRRLKDHIETLSSTLQKIDQIRGVRFVYKDQTKYATGPKIGVIAQELQKVYPEMVTQGKDGFLKVDYTQLTGILIQAVKEQQVEIEELKTRMNKQQEQIDQILKRLK